MNSEDEKSTKHRRGNSRYKKKKSIFSRILFCVMVCFVSAVIAAVITRWDLFSPSSIAEWIKFSDSTKDSFDVKISGTSVLEQNFKTDGKGIVYLSDTSIVQLNHDGETLFSEQHSFTNPVLKCCDLYAVAFNEGGANYKIISEKGLIHSGSQGTAITDCDINDLGTYAVISDQTGYLSKLSVFDKSNSYIFGYSFNDYYAVSVSLSPDGKMAAVGAVNSVEGQFVSKVYLLDFSSTKPLYVFDYNDQIIYDIKFITENKFVVVTDSMVSVNACDSGKEVPYSYGTRVLTAYDVTYSNNVVLSLSNSSDRRNCCVVTLDSKGSEIDSFQTDQKIISVDAKNDKIAVLASNMLYLYNAYGDLFNSWEIGTDAKCVLIPQEKTAYILGVSQMRKMNLK
ncbi:MAG: hypothetical protein II685_00285 [Clostridia bacterium]|nr:hypothetical protein [Clostridia bacterium]